MKATAWPQQVCGKCGPCRRGQYNACQELKVQGFQASGEHELNMFGLMMYRKEDYEEAVKMIDSGQINTAPLISKHFSFEEYMEAYKYIEQQGDKTMKVMIDL